jgi:hypothetical protein
MTIRDNSRDAKEPTPVLTLLITQGASLAKSKTLFFEDGVRQTSRPVQ